MNPKLRKMMQEMQGLAVDYYRHTGRPLGITGELGELLAADILNYELAKVRQEGFDLIKSDGAKVQVKTRALEDPRKAVGNVGAINVSKPWDTVALVLMSNADYMPHEIYEADRKAIENAVSRIPTAGGKMRTEGKARKRGQLAVSEFKRLSKKVWSAPT